MSKPLRQVEAGFTQALDVQRAGGCLQRSPILPRAESARKRSFFLKCQRASRWEPCSSGKLL